MATISLFFWTLDMGFLTDQSFGFFMKIAIFHLSSWLLFSIFNPAQAGMNLFNGNFHQGWLDYQTTSADSAFFIQRTYNSASPYEGLFGKGWCSNVETRLEITAAQLRVVECGGGRVVTYTPAPSRKGSTRSSGRCCSAPVPASPPCGPCCGTSSPSGRTPISALFTAPEPPGM